MQSTVTPSICSHTATNVCGTQESGRSRRKLSLPPRPSTRRHCNRLMLTPAAPSAAATGASKRARLVNDTCMAYTAEIYLDRDRRTRARSERRQCAAQVTVTVLAAAWDYAVWTDCNPPTSNAAVSPTQIAHAVNLRLQVLPRPAEHCAASG